MMKNPARSFFPFRCFWKTGLVLSFGAVSTLAWGDDPAAAPPAGDTMTITADGDWTPFDYSLEVTAGSVFDFSATVDAPAGKYGPVVTTPSGHFQFKNRPGTNVKFWGVNICTQAVYLEKDLADQVAVRLRRSGYNVVRIHHFDRDLLIQGGNSYDIDPDQQDKFDYFVAALEKQGIYINIDLFTLRNFSDEEAESFGWPPPDVRAKGFDRLRWYKATMPISDAAFDSWKKFSTNLLTHRNPYTGYTLAEDPALVGICPLNEDTLIAHVRKVPAITAIYDQKFAEWQKDPAHQGMTDENAAYNQFILETEMNNDKRMRDFLRSIGVHAPLTGCNYIDSEAQAFLRAKYDYVDDHDYWDMPRWLGKEWQLPLKSPNNDPVRKKAQMPREMMPSRVFGKPFTVTEYSYVWPTSDRAVGGLLMSSYASLQDWDGIYYFAYAGKVPAITTPGWTGVLDLAPDPINLLADRVGALIFRRGDVKPATHGVCFAVDKTIALKGAKGVWHEFPKNFSDIGLLTRIGNSTEKPDTILSSDLGKQTNLSAVVTDPEVGASGDHIYPFGDGVIDQLPDDGIVPKSPDGHFVSETGQIDLAPTDGTIKVITDNSECFSLPPSQAGQGVFANLQNGDIQSTVSVVAVDGKPLAKSDRILILHLTNSVNMGTRFHGSDYSQVEAWGTLPHMVRHGETDVTLPALAAGPWHCWAVDVSGNRLGEVELTRTPGGLLLKADTNYKDGVCLAYELVRQGI